MGIFMGIRHPLSGQVNKRSGLFLRENRSVMKQVCYMVPFLKHGGVKVAGLGYLTSNKTLDSYSGFKQI